MCLDACKYLERCCCNDFGNGAKSIAKDVGVLSYALIWVVKLVR